MAETSTNSQRKTHPASDERLNERPNTRQLSASVRDPKESWLDCSRFTAVTKRGLPNALLVGVNLRRTASLHSDARRCSVKLHLR
jgi:hypothetical protein